MKTELGKVWTIQFQEIPVGGYFEYRDRRYLKLALCMACDEDRMGNIFHPQTEVLPDPLPQLVFSQDSLDSLQHQERKTDPEQN